MTIARRIGFAAASLLALAGSLGSGCATTQAPVAALHDEPAWRAPATAPGLASGCDALPAIAERRACVSRVSDECRDGMHDRDALGRCITSGVDSCEAGVTSAFHVAAR